MFPIRRGWLSRADRSSLPYPHRAGWYVSTLVLATGLLASLWWIGNGHNAWTTSNGLPKLGQWLSWFFAQGVGGLGRLVAGDNSIELWGIRCAWLIGFVLVLWVWRRAMFVRNAYKPGPVDVQTLVNGTPEKEPSPQVEDLTAQFRMQLSKTELYAPTNLPAETPADNFLDLLGDVSLEPASLPTSLLRLSSRIRPRIAYRVGGVLAARDESPGFGLTVTLTSYAIRGSRSETFWDTSWERATRTAGYWVVSALLPVTRAGRRAPWRDWRGRDLPRELFAAYQQARELSKKRDFDGALESYYRAVHIDPANVQIRNQIGATQEKLGLYLDALETYHGALAIGRQGSRKDIARLWAGPWNWRRILYQWFLWGQPGALQARYRFAVVLGTSELTAKQWCKTETPSQARTLARQRIRETLRPALVERYWRAVTDMRPDGSDDEVKTWLDETLKITEVADENQRKTVELIFQRASALELCRLTEDYPIGRIFRRFRHDETSLTRSALRISRDVWAPLRLSQAAPVQVEMLPPRAALRWRNGVYKAAARVREWVQKPGDANALKKTVRRAKRYGFKEWQGCYNAACAYAVAMRTCSREYRQDLADEACHELKEAIRRAESGYTTIRRTWLLFDDPDLTELRKTNSFVRFGREVFPHPLPDLPSYEEEAAGEDRKAQPAPTDIEMAAYDRELLEKIGTVMERVWHRRSMQAPANLYTVREWLAKELQVWNRVDTVSAAEARTWFNRRKLLEEVQNAADAALQSRIELPAALPEFDELLASHMDQSDNAWTEPANTRDKLWDFPHHLDTELHRLHVLVKEEARSSPISRSNELRRKIEACASSGFTALSDLTTDPICSRYAAVWQAFTALFSELNDFTRDNPDGLEDFEQALEYLNEPVRLLALGR
ncbi:tetratricopeptide repeat protein [Streptomyces sp. NPDC003943]